MNAHQDDCSEGRKGASREHRLEKASGARKSSPTQSVKVREGGGRRVTGSDGRQRVEEEEAHAILGQSD